VEVCGPPEGTATLPGPGTWEVEARDESGRLVGESPRRLLGSGGITEPRELPPIRPSCSCAVTASLNGTSIAAGAPASTPSGVLAAIGVGGDCGPPCAPGSTSITIQPPSATPHWLGWTALFAPPPVTVPGPSAMYDFPVAGRYVVTLSRRCEDGAACSASFEVHAMPPGGPVLRLPPDPGADPSTCCPFCGADPCLELSYALAGEPPLVPIAGHRLRLDESTLDLALGSACRRDCAEERSVRWEFTSPSGGQEVFEGVALDELTHALRGPGETLLCVIETIPCGGTAQRFENWWIFIVE
jgi:hypothetical protein